MISGTPPPDVKKLAEVYELKDPAFETHVCDRENLFVEVCKKGGNFKEALSPELEAMKNAPTVVYCNSAKKATEVAEHLKASGGPLFVFGGLI